MCAVQHTEDLLYLLQSGVPVNDVDDNGWSAIHWAVWRDVLASVKMLINHGADLTIRSKYGEDALQLAAIFRRVEIVEFLIDYIKPSANREADAYALLGTYCADFDMNTERAVYFFKKSIGVGVQFPVNPPIAAYNNILEITDLESLISIENDPDAVIKQGMIKRERVLSNRHPSVWFGVSGCGDYYYQRAQYRRYVDLRKFSYTRLCAPIRWYEGFELQTRLFYKMIVVDHTSVTLDDVSELIQMGFYNIPDTAAESNILLQFVYLLYVASQLANTDQEKARVIVLCSCLFSYLDMQR